MEHKQINRIMRLATLLLTLALTLSSATAAENRFFELRTYSAAPGKLAILLGRFRLHTTALFEKHGMVNIGYWTPVSNPDNKLVYLLAFANREAREKAWNEFSKDPDWQAIVKESEKDGKLVDRVESIFLSATDFSPEVKRLTLAYNVDWKGFTILGAERVIDNVIEGRTADHWLDGLNYRGDITARWSEEVRTRWPHEIDGQAHSPPSAGRSLTAAILDNPKSFLPDSGTPGEGRGNDHDHGPERGR